MKWNMTFRNAFSLWHWNLCFLTKNRQIIWCKILCILFQSFSPYTSTIIVVWKYGDDIYRNMATQVAKWVQNFRFPTIILWWNELKAVSFFGNFWCKCQHYTIFQTLYGSTMVWQILKYSVLFRMSMIEDDMKRKKSKEAEKAKEKEKQ